MRRFVAVSLYLLCSWFPIAAEGFAAEPVLTPADQLVAATSRGDLDEVDRLLAAGVDVNARSSNGMTAWNAARHAGYAPILEHLATLGANTDVADPPLEDFLTQGVLSPFGDDTPGCAIVVGQRGKIIFEAYLGRASIENERSVDATTSFRIGSVTKQFTSAAILKLQEAGQLSIDDSASKYFPGLAHGDQITLRHLLSHTSGLVNYTSKPDFLERVTQPTTDTEVIDTFKNDPLEFTPGEQYAYSNSGYFLLGHLVTSISETDYDEYLSREFFTPLQMTHTGVHRPSLDLPNEAFGYGFVDGEYQLSLDWDMSHAGGAGALYSTAKDLFLWNEALFSEKILSSESLAQAFAPTTLNNGSTSPYGLGWVSGKHRGLNLIHHSGGLHGFRSHLVRYPSEELTIAVLTNSMPSGPLPSPQQIADTIAEFVLWESMEPIRLRQIDTTVSPEHFADFVGRYDYGSGVLLEVTLEDNQLFAQLTGQPKHPIYPQGEHVFFWKVVDAEVEFVRDDSGNVVKAVHRQNDIQTENARLPDEPPIELTPEQLDEFVGRYSYGTAVMTITRRDNRLFAQLTGQENYEIFPVAPDHFVWRIVKAEIEFQRDAEGKITGGIHSQSGRRFEVPRLPELETIALSPEQLDEYVGEYNYGFLAGKMVVTREGTQLYAKLRGQPRFEIVPVGKDEFRWKTVDAAIKFERNEDGTIVRGIHTQGGRSFPVPKVK